MTVKNKVFLYFSALFLPFILIILGAETTIRMMGGEPGYFIYMPDPDVGWWQGDPDNKRPHINQYGMFDTARSIEKKSGIYRIAVVGDSFMNGVHAGMGNRLSDLIEVKLGRKVESMNFAMSSVGTVQELLIYRHKVRPFKPNLVILGFYSGNDVVDNSRTLRLSSGYSFQKCGYFAIKRSDGFAISNDWPNCEKTHISTVKMFLRQNFALYGIAAKLYIQTKGLLNRFFQKTQQKDASLWNLPWPSTHVPYGVYGPPVHEEWKKSWEITEEFLLKFRNEVHRDGGEFLLLLVTSALEVYPNPVATLRKETGIEPPDVFDVNYPNTRLMTFAKKNQIDIINLTPPFRQYLKENKLKFPYFSFETDGHWSMLGHRVAANIVTPFIYNNYLTKNSDK